MEEYLDSFVCPITHDVMVDPVVASDGHSYERTSITQWFRSNSTSPITNAVVHHKHLVPNHALKQAIHEFRDRFAPFFDCDKSSKRPVPGSTPVLLPMLEPLPERGTFLYVVVEQPMPVYVAPSFVTAQSTSFPVNTIILGKERLYGEDNVIFVELSGHHEGQYVRESTRDGTPCLQRLEIVHTLLAFVITRPTPLSLWPSPSVPSNSLYKAYPHDIVSIEATVVDLEARTYGRLEQSKLWVHLDDWGPLIRLTIDTNPQLYLLPRAMDLCSNANNTNLGVPLIELPAFSLVKSNAAVSLDSSTTFVRTTVPSSHGNESDLHGWLALTDVAPLENPPPRIAEGPAGKLIQLVLQQAGMMALVLDEVQETGDVSQRMFMRHLPRRFERQLFNCVQKGMARTQVCRPLVPSPRVGRRIHRMALGPRGEWYCSGAKPDGTGDCCWASDDVPPRFRAEMEPNSLVTFGDNNEYAMVLGSGGVLSSNISTSLLHRLKRARRVHMMLLARYGGYVVKDNLGMDCSGLDPEFEAALRERPRGAGQICTGKPCACMASPRC
ncbi:hypothetical protein, variant 1 [Aphanomyces invadans]|uniref:U-box domain-containing protein n=1 Tax=Aphanomyces invadans TaxID=157072 RepID=A0A024TM49_9STRA|nr:hypothetical protein, variant 1 [Aphanomyces invadans]ETV94706.1 hypothetical protein, variant 1 [Aphanomyces invadans]|eukprot:XP_008876650.1 hypothetical protein, variant 1 [Aphanomyces invadans]